MVQSSKEAVAATTCDLAATCLSCYANLKSVACDSPGHFKSNSGTPTVMGGIRKTHALEDL